MGYVIKPYTKTQESVYVGLLVDERSYMDEWGDIRPLDSLRPKERVFADTEHARHLVSRGHGEALCWEGNPIRWRHRRGSNDHEWPLSNSDVRVFRTDFPGTEETLRGLIRWRDWLWNYGATPKGSIGGSSMSLLRATLQGWLFLDTAYKDSEAPRIAALIGGRQFGQNNPEWFKGRIENHDMPSAYASILGHLPYGRGWLEMPSRAIRADILNRWDGRTLVFLEARVRVPDMEHGPLPERPDPRFSPKFTQGLIGQVFPTGETVEGIWSIAELREAAIVGCDIDLMRAWIHIEPTDGVSPFLPWYRAIVDGRSMPGFAAHLAKMTGNALWGQFAINPHGQKSIRRFVRNRYQGVKVTHRGSPRALDIAEHLTGLVRARLYGFNREAGERMLFAHTDGAWIHNPDNLRIDGWRVKQRTFDLRYINPTCFAFDEGYRKRKGHRWRYVTAQWPDEYSKQEFERAWQSKLSTR